MADVTNELFAIDVDADDYAETAAGDTPSVPRTFQSEADFELQKQSYRAKISYGNNLEELFIAVPELRNAIISETKPEENKIRLGKKHVQLLNYAVGELYFDHNYAEVIDLCDRVSFACETDQKLRNALKKWTDRSQQKMG